MITISNNIFTIENSLISRQITFDGKGLFTNSFFNKKINREFTREIAGGEFYFCVDGRAVFGNSNTISADAVINKTAESPLVFIKARQETNTQTKEEKLILNLEYAGLGIDIIFSIRDDSAGIEKSLRFKNKGTKTIHLNNVMIECLNLLPGRQEETRFFCSNGLEERDYKSDYSSEHGIIQFHNALHNFGFYLGTTVPAVLKRAYICTAWGREAIMLGVITAILIRLVFFWSREKR
ncbi:MAG: hypothetical protein A2096_11990 [Spirochaetes bacterium GWF1_41_5]|nr:MAG: hypothetical protein A2096_11990 [Spirochaetes bacterium GWF1_41_5]HBE01010.1 hypothetical protein [Spirochaetia bacterium]